MNNYQQYKQQATDEKKAQEAAQQKKENIIRAATMAGVAVFLFYIAPYMLMAIPEENRELPALLLFMICNHLFFAVVGWQSNHFGKYALLGPVIVLLLYMGSEYLLYHSLTGTMELNYIESCLLAFFIKRLANQRMAKAENQNQFKKFPKGVTGRK